MITREQVQQAYVDYVLTHNQQPNSVYIFAKQLDSSEAEFYNHFASFNAIEKSIWTDLTQRAIHEVQQQEPWNGYSSREKMLSFFYAYVELLKSQRSFIVYSLNKQQKFLSAPAVLDDVRPVFEGFAENIIHEGLESKELADRRFLSKRYKDALWVQFGFILNFWVNDSSNGFEKTDEAIERGINVTFDLFQYSPLDNLLEYGKFITRNSRFKERMRF
jgi:hypothetical protein